jgi:hypothetical protein
MFCGAVCGGCEDEYEQGIVLAVLAVLASKCFDCTKLCEAPHHPRGGQAITSAASYPRIPAIFTSE